MRATLFALPLLLGAAVVAQAQSGPVTPTPPANGVRTNATYEAVPNTGDRIVCRRIEVIGSLIRRERVCKPASEWRRLGDRGNDVARQQFEGGMVCSGGSCRGG